MPVGTYGTVKGMTPEEVEATGAQIILGNTFHLWLRPGQEIMKLHGDLHDFMQWKRPIPSPTPAASRSFSLGDIRKITKQGVHFRNPIKRRSDFPRILKNQWRFSTIFVRISVP
ncbi:tRNA-guanine transglycosylase [Escherichia coli]